MILRLVAEGEIPCGCRVKIFEVHEPPRRRKDQFLQVNHSGFIPLGRRGSLTREIDAHEMRCLNGGAKS